MDALLFIYFYNNEVEAVYALRIIVGTYELIYMIILCYVFKYVTYKILSPVSTGVSSGV